MVAVSVRAKILAGVAIAIVIVVFGFCERQSGKKIGALNQKVVASAARVKSAELAVRAADPVAKAEVEKSVTKRANYHEARATVEVKGDSVFADGQRVDMPSVAAALEKADTMSTQDSTAIREQARSDTLKTALVGALNDHVDLLQEEKRPRIGMKTGIAIGVVGTCAVVYIAVKIIRAVGHR
jgi:hypothetical protein